MRFSTCQINDQPVVLGWISGRVFWKPWKIDLDKLLAVFTMDVLTKGLFPSLLGLSDDSFGEVVEKQFISISIFKWQDGWMEYQKTLAFLFVFLFVVSFHTGFSFLSFFLGGEGGGVDCFFGEMWREKASWMVGDNQLNQLEPSDCGIQVGQRPGTVVGGWRWAKRSRPLISGLWFSTWKSWISGES